MALSTEPIDVGDVAVVRVTFSDPETGAAADPETVTITLKSPTGETYPIIAARITAGVYEAERIMDSAGVWKYRGVGTDPARGVDQGTFRVRESNIA